MSSLNVALFRAFLIYCLLVSPGLLASLSPRDAALIGFMPFLMLLLPSGFGCFGRRWAQFGWLSYSIWACIWVAGYAATIILQLRYQLRPLDVPVITAIINTNRHEATEFISDAGVLVLLSGAVSCLAVAGGLTLAMKRLVLRAARAPSQRIAALALGILQLTIIIPLHGNSLVEKADPLTMARRVLREARNAAADSEAIRVARLHFAAQLPSWKATYKGPRERTLVLVIGESSNRWDWSLYGYSRDTNPQLEKLRDELLVFKDVVSSYGSTGVEITRMLTVADAKSENDWRNEPSIINLARDAGYKTFWLTNQSYPFISALFGNESDLHQSVYEGRFAGEDLSLDEKLLPALDNALADPAPLKLIVLHTVGSHMRYQRRYTDSFDVFGKKPDLVDETMQNRWIWLRWRRAEYDNSILYTDNLLAQMISRLKAFPGVDASFLFVSDHAQDVGHLTGTWGHQLHLESGFTVPFLLWQKGVQPRRELESRPYQTDHLEQTLLHLMAIDTARSEPQFDLLGDAFKPWQRMIDGRPYVPGVSHRPQGNPPISGR